LTATAAAMLKKYNDLTNWQRDAIIEVYFLLCSCRFVLIAFEAREREATDPEEQASVIADRCSLTKRVTKII